jgi:MarR family transcriptional regulator, organic hydroperoxide resistance regulator
MTTMKQQRQAGFLMAKIHQLGGRIFSRLLKRRGIDEINPAQGRILFVLWREDRLSINELAKRTQLGKSTLTSMLDRLENAGWIVRMPSRTDRRKIHIKRTLKDKALEHLYVQVSQEMTHLWYQGFTAREIDRFEHSLQRILDNLERFDAEEVE